MPFNNGTPRPLKRNRASANLLETPIGTEVDLTTSSDELILVAQGLQSLGQYLTEFLEARSIPMTQARLTEFALAMETILNCQEELIQDLEDEAALFHVEQSETAYRREIEELDSRAPRISTPDLLSTETLSSPQSVRNQDPQENVDPNVPQQTQDGSSL